MTLAYLTDDAGVPVLLEDIPDDVRRSLAERGIDLVEGILPAGDGEHVVKVVFSLDKAAEAERIERAVERLLLAQIGEEPEVYARKPLTDRERDLLYGDGSGRPLGILDGSAFYQEPTESDSRQRRRWIARKGRR